MSGRQQDDEWTINGPDAPVAIHMIIRMAQYLSGPGLDGFTAWLDQQLPHIQVSREAVRGNARDLARKFSTELHGRETP